ncbi:rod shape-determining protein MreC [Oceanivirga miroungae]|uniref:Cell shape-determining protein MreC n=1 Tax=Oceanivirga miroungae TaxID=1130046 RepID=A0A6I8M5P1_9FUSO|nr:rod shape-determining protein MreC [Oceanivirga miroungae]VWL85249.1 Rod shape-determining protein MreC [Oceanivirga miroungae]
MRSRKDNKLIKYLISIIVILMLVVLLKRPASSIYSYITQKTIKLNDLMINFKSKIYTDIEKFIKKEEMLSNFDKYLEKIEKKEGKYQKLELDLVDLEKLKKENKKLKDLLNLKEELSYDAVAAKVILKSEHDDEYIYISKGKNEGIEEDLVVIYDANMIGRIYKVYDTYSKVKLLVNKTSKLSVIVNKKELGILRGNGNSFSINNYNIDKNKIDKTYVIESSGISNKIPKGVKIGTFSLKNKESFLETKELRFYPNYNYLDMDYVLILKEKKGE